MAATATPKISNAHHIAYRCRDAVETRRFYEGVLGLELEAALAFDEISGTDVKLRYMHLFFKMGDGNFVAFFDVPEHDRPDLFRARSGLNRHIALEVATEAEQLELKKRMEAAGYEVMGPIDHGFVKSIYMDDPNGIQVEITRKSPQYDQIMAHEKSLVDEAMKSWEQETKERKDALRAAMQQAAKPAAKKSA